MGIPDILRQAFAILVPLTIGIGIYAYFIKYKLNKKRYFFIYV